MEGHLTNKCDANRLPSACIETTSFLLATTQEYQVPQTCPNSYPDPYFRTLTDYPRIRCLICNEPVLSADRHGGIDIYTGELVFGPNQVDGTVTEEFIQGYAIMKATLEGVTFGAALAIVNKIGGMDPACCSHDAYNVLLEGVNVKDAERLVVAPIDLNGITMPTGNMVPFVDLTSTTTTTSSSTHTTTLSTKTTTSTITVPPIPTVTNTVTTTVGAFTEVAFEVKASFDTEEKAAAAIADPEFTKAAANAMCNITNISAEDCSSMMNVTARLAETRRLRGSLSASVPNSVVLDDDEQDDADRTRRLASATVIISYEISIPASSSVNADDVKAQVQQAQTDSSVFTTALDAAIAAPDSGIAAGTYTITSVEVGDITVTDIVPPTANATTTTAIKRGVTGGANSRWACSSIQLLAIIFIGMLANA